MAEERMMRLSQAAKILNVGHTTLLERLSVKGFKVESNPNAKLSGEHLDYLAKEYKSDELLGGGTKKPEPAAPAVEQKTNQSDDEIGWFRPPVASNNIVPAFIGATQNSGAPLPLPIRTSSGFFVTGLSGNIRIQTWPSRFIARVTEIRAASIWRAVISPGSTALMAKVPKAISCPREAIMC